MADFIQRTYPFPIISRYLICQCSVVEGLGCRTGPKVVLYVSRKTMMSSSKSLIVTTTSGQIQGLWEKSNEGNDFRAFRGIPYAEAPVGDLRFRLPVGIGPWSGILQAFRCGPCVPQYNQLSRYFRSASCILPEESNIKNPLLSPLFVARSSGKQRCYWRRGQLPYS